MERGYITLREGDRYRHIGQKDKCVFARLFLVAGLDPPLYVAGAVRTIPGSGAINPWGKIFVVEILPTTVPTGPSFIAANYFN